MFTDTCSRSESCWLGQGLRNCQGLPETRSMQSSSRSRILLSPIFNWYVPSIVLGEGPARRTARAHVIEGPSTTSGMAVEKSLPSCPHKHGLDRISPLLRAILPSFSNTEKYLSSSTSRSGIVILLEPRERRLSANCRISKSIVSWLRLGYSVPRQ